MWPPSPTMGSPAGRSRNFHQRTVANVKGLQSGLFFDHALPRCGGSRVEGLQGELRAAPAAGAPPESQPHLLRETEGHGVRGPGSRGPFPAPVPSGPDEVSSFVQGHGCPRRQGPAPRARPSTPAWPGSASRTGFHSQLRAAPEPQLPGLPIQCGEKQGAPPGRLHSQQSTVTRGTSVSSPGSLVGTGDSQTVGPARQHGEPGTSCLQKQPPPWVPTAEESRGVSLQEKR